VRLRFKRDAVSQAAQITFVKGPSGAVTGLVLHQGGRDMPAKKLK